jgi:DNA gyrase subunit A
MMKLSFTDRGNVFPSEDDIYQPEWVSAAFEAETMDKNFMVLATKNGEVKKVPATEFEEVRHAGFVAMNLEAGDLIAVAALADDCDHVVLLSSRERMIRFPCSRIRPASRQSGGVRGMRLSGADDAVVAIAIIRPEDFERLPLLSRGGKGVGMRGRIRIAHQMFGGGDHRTGLEDARRPLSP